jgi:hypothetical protein
VSDDTPAENPFRDVETVLRVVRGALERGDKAGLGSDEALAQMSAAVGTVTDYFRDHIRAAFPRDIESPSFQADAERALGLFWAADGFLGEMAGELQLAFAGLRIGDVRTSVKPASAQGGVTPLYALHLKSMIVGAADHLKARGGGHEAYEAELRARGLNSRSVADYRRQIARTETTNLPVKFMNDKSMDNLVKWAVGQLKKK